MITEEINLPVVKLMSIFPSSKTIHNQDLMSRCNMKKIVAGLTILKHKVCPKRNHRDLSPSVQTVVE